METTDKRNYCVILAGGRGQRLWPVSREKYPKQFVDLFRHVRRTQLQTTVDRFARLLPKENIFICTCREYFDLVRTQAPEVPERNVIVEPIHRNTAPRVACARCVSFGRTKMRISSSRLLTSWCSMNTSLPRSVDVGVGYVSENDVLLAMGVKPTRAEPGYGYIQIGDQSCKPDVYKVKSFTEKPERDFAKMFMESGEFYWNTGIFICNARHLIHTFEEVFPPVLRNLKFEKPDYTYEEEMDYVAENYPRYPNLSLDYAILEQNRNVYVMKCDFGWADLGTWHSIYEVMSKVKDDNVVMGSEVMLEDCHNNIIRLPKGKLGVFNGLEGYIVAEEGDVLMICKKSDNSSMVKKYVNEVRIKYGDEFV